MKKLTLILPLLLASINAKSQFGFHSIGVETFHGVSHNKTQKKTDASDGFHLNQTPKYSYGVSISTEIFKTKRISIRPYVGFLNLGMKTAKQSLTYGDQIDPQTDFPYTTNDPSSVSSISYVHHFYSVNLGSNATFFVTTGKTSLFIQVSPEYNYFTNYQHIIKKWDNNDDLTAKEKHDFTNESAINRSNFTLGGAIGFKRNISEKLSFEASFNYKENLFTVVDKWITKDRFYAAGIKIGLIYNL